MEASRAGVPTGARPVVGAIAVFGPWQGNASASGHVAYVEAVNGDVMTISESNWAQSRGWMDTSGNYHPGDVRTIAWAGLSFIYGGPAGDGLVNRGSSLPTNGMMQPGEELVSANGQYRFVIQADSNIVLYGRGRALWASNTVGSNLAYLVMQRDGNLVAYTDTWRPVWASNTYLRGIPPYMLILQDDGNAVIYAYGYRAVWDTGTWR